MANILVYSQLFMLFFGSLFLINSNSDNNFKLVWADEFNSNEINSKNWTMQKGGGAIWGNNELQYYTDSKSNCFLKDGILTIQAQKENYNNFNYTSARLITRDKIDFKYGKIEIRAKLPKGKGLWPAIWLLPSENTYDDRLKNGEIDIMEFLGNNANSIFSVIHYFDTDKKSFFNKYTNENIDFSEDFHLFSLLWDKDKLEFFVDNNKHFSFSLKGNFTGSYKPFSKPFYLIMNLAVGGDWPGSPDSSTEFPAKLEIDYVKYYNKVNSFKFINN